MTSATVGLKTGLMNLKEMNYPGSMPSVSAFPVAWDFKLGETCHSHLSQQDQRDKKPCPQFRKQRLELQKPFLHQAPEPLAMQRKGTLPFISTCDQKNHFIFLSPCLHFASFPTQHPNYNNSFFLAINTAPSQMAEIILKRHILKYSPPITSFHSSWWPLLSKKLCSTK